MSPLDKVKAIVAHIKATNLEVISDPGLSSVEILNAFKAIKLLPPSEIIELYQWHNGIGELDCYLNFMNLRDAIMWYLRFKSCYAENDNYYCGWNRDWFPLLNMNNDILLCLNFKTLSIARIIQTEDLCETVAWHYIQYLDALLYMFDNKLFEFDDFGDNFGCIEFDRQEWNKMLHLHQIKSPW